MEVKPSLSPVRRLVQILDDAPHIHEREERVRDDITGHNVHLNRSALSACRHEPRRRALPDSNKCRQRSETAVLARPAPATAQHDQQCKSGTTKERCALPTHTRSHPTPHAQPLARPSGSHSHRIAATHRRSHAHLIGFIDDVTFSSTDPTMGVMLTTSSSGPFTRTRAPPSCALG